MSKKSSQLEMALWVAVLVLFGLLVTTAARASTITPLNCQSGCTGAAYGGALWSTVSVQPSGTGVFQPFVRIHNSPVEDGHNTSAPSQTFLNDEVGGIWTHDVLTADLTNVFNIGGVDYYEFMLDLGEPGTDKKSLIGLERLELCTSNTASLVSDGGCPTSPSYSLDGGGDDRTVNLDYNLFGGGNGNSDLFVYIPKATLGATPGTYFYMYTLFGHEPGYASEGTFEEWAFRDGPDSNPCPGPDPCVPTPQTFPTPEPASMVLLGTGLFGLAARLRRKKA